MFPSLYLSPIQVSMRQLHRKLRSLFTTLSLFLCQNVENSSLTYRLTVWTAWDKSSAEHKEAGVARLLEERRIAEQAAQARKDEIKNSAA